MKELSVFKKDMRAYFKTTVDKEEGETFTDWFVALIDCLREDGKIKTIEGKTYIED